MSSEPKKGTIIAYKTNRPSFLNANKLLLNGLKRTAEHGLNSIGIGYYKDLSAKVEETFQKNNPWTFVDQFAGKFCDQKLPEIMGAIAHTSSIEEHHYQSFNCQGENFSLVMRGKIGDKDAVIDRINGKAKPKYSCECEMLGGLINVFESEGQSLPDAIKNTCKIAGGEFALTVMEKNNLRRFFMAVHNDEAFYIRNNFGIYASTHESPLFDWPLQGGEYKKKDLGGKKLLHMDLSLPNKKLVEVL